MYTEDSKTTEPTQRTATYNGWTYTFVINDVSIAVYDENGDWVTVLPVDEGNKLEDDDLSALIHMYIKGIEVGRRAGIKKAQHAMREALGLN